MTLSFQDNDPGNLVRKFMKECQLLSTIKHPNIVQYLSTASDPQSGRPVLLMELSLAQSSRTMQQTLATNRQHISS
jgi:serine/threonine protein kinase